MYGQETRSSWDFWLSQPGSCAPWPQEEALTRSINHTPAWFSTTNVLDILQPTCVFFLVDIFLGRYHGPTNSHTGQSPAAHEDTGNIGVFKSALCRE